MLRGLLTTGKFNELKENNFSTQDQYDPFQWELNARNRHTKFIDKNMEQYNFQI